MKLMRTITSISCLMLAACSRGDLKIPAQTNPFTPISEITPSVQAGMSPEAAEYLNDAFGIMEKNSINKYKVNWSELKATCFLRATNARFAAGTYSAIKCILNGLEDHHSYFIPATQNSGTATTTASYAPPPQAKLIQDKFGYVIVQGYKNSPFGNQFGTDMQKQIQTIDQQHPCGWIVDLRGNTGGELWPMLVGIGPILGEGEAGSFIDAAGHQDNWGYWDGKGLDNGQVISEVIGQPYHLIHPGPPVAVLFDNGTLSSGEAIAIAFVGRPDTRSFGNNSGGITTANKGFPLSGGAMIVLTTAVDADRTGKLYGGAITPAVPVNNDAPGMISTEVLDWLASQPACK